MCGVFLLHVVYYIKLEQIYKYLLTKLYSDIPTSKCLKYIVLCTIVNEYINLDERKVILAGHFAYPRMNSQIV